MNNIVAIQNNDPGYGVVSDRNIDQVISRQPTSLCFGTRRCINYFYSNRVKKSCCIKKHAASSFGVASCGGGISGALLMRPCHMCTFLFKPNWCSNLFCFTSTTLITGGIFCVLSECCFYLCCTDTELDSSVILKLRDHLNRPHSWLRYNDAIPPVQEVMQAIERVSFRSDLPEKIVNRDHLRQNLEELCRGSKHRAYFDEFIGLIPVQCRFYYEYVFFYQQRIKSSEASLVETLENLRRCINNLKIEITESDLLLDDGHSNHPAGSQRNEQSEPDDPNARLECASQCIGIIFSIAELQAAMILGFCAASTHEAANHHRAADKAYLQNALVYFKKMQNLKDSATLARAVAGSAKDQQSSEVSSHGDGLELQCLDSQTFACRLAQFNRTYSDFLTCMSKAASLIHLLQTLEKESIFFKPASSCC